MRFDEFQDRLRALDGQRFEQFVFDILIATDCFRDVQLSVRVQHCEYDIVAIEKDALAGTPTAWYFEVKHWKRPVGVEVIHDVVYRFQQLKSHGVAVRFVLITSGVLTAGAINVASLHGVEVWDSSKLAQIAPTSLVEEYLGGSIDLPREELPEQKRASALISLLDSLAAGKAPALDYQRAVADTLEFLFCPALEPPAYEVTDAARRNRRDIILENYAPDGFWAYLRAQYRAEYIIVDAKNYAGPLKKQPVVEVAHYLKPYGCGMLAIITSRKGPGPSAEHAMREQWIGAGKMIIVVNDVEMKEMIRLRAEGGPPESVIRAKIAAFRMAL